MKEFLNKIIVIAVIAIIFGTIFGVMFNGYLNSQTKEIIVSDKYIKRVNEKDVYLVVDGDKNTYKITDLFLKLKFNSTDIYNQLEKGNRYRIHTTGFRIKILSEYPNINKAEEVK